MTLTKNEDIKLHDANIRKMGVPWFEKSSFLNGMKMPWYSASSFIFCPEPTIIKDIWMRTIPVTIMAIISNVLLWQLLVITYVKSYFSTITRQIHNGFWKTPCSWRFYGHGLTYVIILFWVNIMTQKWAKLPWKLSVAQKSEPVLQRALHKDISRIIKFFFFSQTNLVLKFNLNLVLIE